MSLLLVIILLVVLFGGGYGGTRTGWYGVGAPAGIVGLLITLMIVWFLFNLLVSAGPVLP